MRQTSLRPGDVVVALQVALCPESPLAQLADGSARSVGEVHNAIARLKHAGLMAAEGRCVELEPLLQFIRWGVPFAFPPAIGGNSIGVATATLGERATKGTDAQAHPEFVWASAAGTLRGAALTPLHPRVPEIAERNPRLYALLAAVDLVRVGGTRERAAASNAIERLIANRALRG